MLISGMVIKPKVDNEQKCWQHVFPLQIIQFIVAHCWKLMSHASRPNRDTNNKINAIFFHELTKENDKEAKTVDPFTSTDMQKCHVLYNGVLIVS